MQLSETSFFFPPLPLCSLSFFNRRLRFYELASQLVSQPASQASHKVAVFQFKKYYRAFHFFFSPSPPSPPSPLLRQ